MENTVIKKLPGYFLLTCLILATIAVLYLLRPFLQVLLISAVLTISFYKGHKLLLRIFKSPNLSALISCVTVFLIIIVPLTLFLVLVANEAIDTYKLIQIKIESGYFDSWLGYKAGGSRFFSEYIEPLVNVDISSFKATILEVAQKVSTFLATQIGNLVVNLLNLIFSFLIMLFAMFYFFRDGEKIAEKIRKLSPLPKKHEEEITKKTATMVKAITLGVFLTAMVEGLLGGIAFAIIGIQNPIFWGAMMAFLSLVPLVGPTLIWIPATIILFLDGAVGSSIFLFAWGVLAIGSVEYISRTYFIGYKTKSYPLLIFLIVIGGIWTMGFKGIIVGPLVLMIFMSLLHVYEIEYKKILK